MANYHQKRRQNTKKLIYDALIILLQTHTINQISIRELSQIANINRSTFYNHYSDQYDVLDEMVREHVTNTSSLLVQGLAENKDITLCLIHALQYIKDNVAFARVLLVQEHYDLVSNVKKAMPIFDEVIISKLPEKISTDEKMDVALFVQYGVIRVLKHWIISGCKRSPQKEAETMLNLVTKTLSDYHQ
ncbi:TetR family transcriptional regulator [Leuconostoc litchii]|uniref:HTH tetR-type domain-containing protein n=1 Tax=Leuconostoc litchii TaxID=1981069 RepID=A0A6P2CRW8_9LACO|nr:TetR/AcrR family transcriptional regulator [Leuconostoc litchii]TYC47047.1 hypothetical protein ESZ47_02630 [Leuconostoc litchii]GMA68975.1 TetR family transcriptional regulator [Leuconostoc litchii]